MMNYTTDQLQAKFEAAREELQEQMATRGSLDIVIELRREMREIRAELQRRAAQAPAANSPFIEVV